jgi:addiction module HigA family antidote
MDQISRLVETAKSVHLTEAQWEEQRRSFVYGNTALANEHITREMVDRQAVDLTDVIDPEAEPVGPIHPGYILLVDFMEPLGLSVYALARALSVPRTRLGKIVNERRPITADTALRLSRHFGASADFWMGLQVQYDLELARRELGDRLMSEGTLRAASVRDR